MRKKIAYTVIIGPYEQLNPVRPEFRRGWELRCLVDRALPNDQGWTIINVEQYRGGLSDLAFSRKLKALSHLYINEADISLYLDGSNEIIGPLDDFYAQFEGESFVSVQHPDRNCAYEEMEACVSCKRAAREAMDLQKETYLKLGFPKNWGLFENQVLLRVNASKVAEINEMWWTITETFGNWRDQLTLPMAFWKLGQRPKVIAHKFKETFFRQVTIHKGIYA